MPFTPKWHVGQLNVLPPNLPVCSFRNGGFLTSDVANPPPASSHEVVLQALLYTVFVFTNSSRNFASSAITKSHVLVICVIVSMHITGHVK